VTKKLPIADESALSYEHPLYSTLLHTPGLSVGVTILDKLLTWGTSNALWVFPMATSCCGIELMAAAASRVDLDRMGTIVRATPRQCDVMVVAGTITVKMAPRVKKLWDQMPEPKWCIAMGSCAISGDFYRDLYPVVPGIDTFLPVDVYIPGCPPNPEGLMHGLLRLAEKIRAQRAGTFVQTEARPESLVQTRPSLPRLQDPDRKPELGAAQTQAALDLAVSTTERPIEPLAESEPTGPEAVVAPAPVSSSSPSPASDSAADSITALLKEHGATDFPADAPPFIPANRHVALARALVARGYKQLVTIVATHFPAGKSRAGATAGGGEHYEIAYALRSVGRGSKIVTWCVRVELGGAISTLFPVLAGADWQEREQWDLVGVLFAGHPDLRRLMMPEDWQGHPLRKDYAADTHTAPWR
jgi:NADH-quinone oxidoreductase B subunit